MTDEELAEDLRRLSLTTRDCGVCDGDGIKANGNTCGGCNGTGQVPVYWGAHKTMAAAAEAIERLSAANALSSDDLKYMGRVLDSMAPDDPARSDIADYLDENAAA